MLNSVCLDRLRQEDLKWALEISTLHLLLFFKLEVALSKFKNENFNLYTKLNRLNLTQLYPVP